MALLEALSSTELFNFLMYDTTLAHPATSPFAAATSHDSSDGTLIPLNFPKPQQQEDQEQGEENVEAKAGVVGRKRVPRRRTRGDKAIVRMPGGRSAFGAQQGARKKRKRRPRVFKNEEEVENQRMTHIVVERNRRKQMNEHLAVLRSLMPDSYVQRGDQASIVGGAVEFVKELEHLLQNLEAQKLQLRQRGKNPKSQNQDNKNNNDDDDEDEDEDQQQQQQQQQEDHVTTIFSQPPFSQFCLYPQITWSQLHNNNNNNNFVRSSGTTSVADIEVTMIETHANLRILSRKKPQQLSKLVTGFHSLRLAILHLSVTTLGPLVLYSISAKVEEGCQLSKVDDIAGAAHRILRIIEEGSEA